MSTDEARIEARVVELDGVLAELERLHERCEKGLILRSEVTQLLRALDERARAALPRGSDLFRLYDSGMSGVTEYWRKTIGPYVSPTDSKNIGRRIEVLRQVLKEIEPDFLRGEHDATAQIYFQAGEVFRACQEFYRLLKRATVRLDIADPYLDPDVFDFIDVLDPGLAVRLLTGKPKPLFVSQLHALQASRPSLEAHSNDQNHDRFVFLDGVVVWHLGASINGLGKKAFMMSRIAEAGEASKALADFENWWNNGTSI